jgi:hypothetical protein
MAKLQTTKQKEITPMNTLMKTFNSNTCRILFATCLSVLCFIALSTQAATISVTSTNDSGAGSLRQAIADSVNGDTIDFDPSLNGQTITLVSDELLVSKNISINGPGPNNLTIDGNHAWRVFHVIGGVTATIGGLTITNGFVSGFFPNGNGGGIYNDHSTLTVTNCTISGNSASDSLGQGGGIINAGYLVGYFGYGPATLEVVNCTINGNSAGLDGGGIFNNGQSGSATLTVTGSTVSGNTVTGGYGGGIATDGNGGSSMVEVVNSTLSDNSVRSFGGGIMNSSAYGGTASLRVRNSTISNNWGGDYGGGIYNAASAGGNSPLEVTHSTLSGNSCLWLDGGGIANLSGATSQVGSTIFYGNRISNGGTTTSLGYNLSSDDGSGFLTATGDQINTDAMLGPLQDNGGPTFTHAPLQGSPAIDAGDPNFDPNAFNPPMLYDQRGPGYNRVAHGRVDIGAFEVQVVIPSYAGQVQPPINPDGSSTFNVRRGVVPLKFNLTLGALATCDLPLATIAVTRTAGGVIGEINESDYSGNADTGSNFRIDNCQYVYNLNSRALGVGTYRVDILINGQVVGSAVFGLN